MLFQLKNVEINKNVVNFANDTVVGLVTHKGHIALSDAIVHHIDSLIIDGFRMRKYEKNYRLASF